MPARSAWTRPAAAWLVATAAFVAGGCHLDVSSRAEARDQWKRHYTLAAGGTLEIRNTVGVIQVEQGADNGIDVTADRIVRAFNDEAAKDGLARFQIQEDVKPDRIVIDSSTQGQTLMINQQRSVEYHVRVPSWVNLTLHTTNGELQAVGDHFTGEFRATSTNGRVRARGLEGNAVIETTNGTVDVEVNRLGDRGISCETTNGMVTLVVPPAVSARLSARVTNGEISTSGLNLAIAEQSRHRLDGTLNGGGPPIKIETTNGGVRIRAKASS